MKKLLITISLLIAVQSYSKQIDFNGMVNFGKTSMYHTEWDEYSSWKIFIEVDGKVEIDNQNNLSNLDITFDVQGPSLNDNGVYTRSNGYRSYGLQRDTMNTLKNIRNLTDSILVTFQAGDSILIGLGNERFVKYLPPSRNLFQSVLNKVKKSFGMGYDLNFQYY